MAVIGVSIKLVIPRFSGRVPFAASVVIFSTVRVSGTVYITGQVTIDSGVPEY